MSMVRSLRSVKNIFGKKVLVRVDTNVPIKDGRILDDTRIRAIIPTLQFLIKKKAKIIIIAHLGRPEGVVVPNLTLDPIAVRLGQLLKRHIEKIPSEDWKKSSGIFKMVQTMIEVMKPGQLVMLDNIRFSPDETNNKGNLAKQLASLADFFVQDGFSVCHRADASVLGIAKLLPSYAGLLLVNELQGLDKIFHASPQRFLVILGGAKMETKLPVLKKFLKISGNIVVGGGIANTILAARGYDVGASLVDKNLFATAKRLARNKKIVMPHDVVVGNKEGTSWRIVTVDSKPHGLCEKDEAILDIGPATITLVRNYIDKAKTLVWNGALGYFEQQPYDEGTFAVARAIAQRQQKGIFSVVGGGETVEVIQELNLSKKFGLVSTGGGAMLEFLAGNKLPGIKVLEHKR